MIVRTRIPNQWLRTTNHAESAVVGVQSSGVWRETQADEFDGAVIVFASKASIYMTGSNLMVERDGQPHIIFALASLVNYEIAYGSEGFYC